MTASGKNTRQKSKASTPGAARAPQKNLEESQKALQIMEELFQAVIDNSLAAITVRDLEGRYLYVNSQAEANLGLKRGEIIGKTVGEISSQIDPQQIAADDKALLASSQALKFENTVNLAGGPHTFLSNRFLIRDEQGQPFAIGSIATDITDIRRAEQQLRASEERFRVLSNASFEGLALQEGGHLIEANQTLAGMFGYSREELLAKSPDDLIAPESREKFRERLANFSEEPVELYVLNKDGTRLLVEARSREVEYQGRPVRLTAVRDITELRRIEQEGRESDERFQVLSEASFEGLIISHQSQIIMANRPAAQMYGYTMAELLKMPIERLIAAEDAPTLTWHLANGDNQPVEVTALRKDGTRFPVEIQSRKISYKGHQVRITAWRDITAHKKAEAALRESQERFKSAFELSGIGMALIDLEGRYLQVNQALCDMLGYSEAELLLTNFQAITHPSDLNNDLEHIKQLLTNQTSSYDIEKRYLHKNDAIIWVLLTRSLVRDNRGQPLYFISQVQDITERKRSEQALRLSEARFSGIIKSATDAIITLNPQQRIVLFNRAAEQMFGRTAEAVLGERVDILLPERFRPMHSQHIRDFARTGVSARSMTSPFSTLAALRANGEEFPIEATISQVEAESQKFFTVIIRDVSEREKSDKALRDKEEQLRQSQKMEAVGRLAGGVAHDFNNLLTVIVNYSEFMASQPNDTALVKEGAEEILAAVARASALTRQLMSFSRQQVLQPRLITMDEVVENTSKMLQRLIGEDIELLLRLNAASGRILIDPVQIEQVILNLAVNARDAMPRGGKLIIETSEVVLDDAYTSTHLEAAPGPFSVLSVSDTGFGMAEEVKAHIFEPFFTTKEKGKGTGLGLATVYGIVQQHKGTIWIYSELGLGTTFKIYFPHSQEGATTPTSKVEINETHLEGHETILLVEDERQIRSLARRLLEEKGYNVLEAQNGLEALEYIEHYTKPIDMVLSDVVMPKMGGRALEEKLRELRPEIRFVYMSGYTGWSSESDEAYLSQTANFLEKPFNSKSLLTKVREIFNSEKV
jgi:PAS domain S-box-containing protein